MKKLFFYTLLLLLVHQGFGQTMNNYNPIKDAAINNDVDTSLNKTKKIIMQGVYLEGLGKNGYYSLGYEYQILKRIHSFGIGGGLSYRRINGPGIKYSNFSINISPFYEYGKSFGIRLGFNAGISLNPIVFSNKLDYLHYADKPPIYLINPAVEVGFFYRTPNNRFQFTLSGYLFYINHHYTERNYWSLQPWLGLTIKYNFKITTK